jgi:hypothetical protein
MITAEHALRNQLAQYDPRDFANSEGARALAAIHVTIGNNITLYNRLLEQVMLTERRYAERLDEAGFRYRVIKFLPDFEPDVLNPALSLPPSSPAFEGLLAAFLLPRPCQHLTIRPFIDAALAPARRADAVVEEDDAEKREVEQMDPVFSAADEEEAAAFLARVLHGTVTMSELLALADGEGMCDAAVHAMVLIVLEAFKEGPIKTALSVRRVDGEFIHRPVRGRELEVAYGIAEWWNVPDPE